MPKPKALQDQSNYTIAGLLVLLFGLVTSMAGYGLSREESLLLILLGDMVALAGVLLIGVSIGISKKTARAGTQKKKAKK